MVSPLYPPPPPSRAPGWTAAASPFHARPYAPSNHHNTNAHDAPSVGFSILNEAPPNPFLPHPPICYHPPTGATTRAQPQEPTAVQELDAPTLNARLLG